MIVTMDLSSGSRRRHENGFVDSSVWERNELDSLDLSVPGLVAGVSFRVSLNGW